MQLKQYILVTIMRLDIDDIKIEEKIGHLSDSQLIHGIVLDKTIDNNSMPKFIEHAKIF